MYIVLLLFQILCIHVCTIIILWKLRSRHCLSPIKRSHNTGCLQWRFITIWHIILYISYAFACVCYIIIWIVCTRRETKPWKMNCSERMSPTPLLTIVIVLLCASNEIENEFNILFLCLSVSKQKKKKKIFGFKLGCRCEKKVWEPLRYITIRSYFETIIIIMDIFCRKLSRVVAFV